MHEPLRRVPQGGVDEGLGAEHVGADTGLGLPAGPVDVGLGGEVHDLVVCGEQFVDEVEVADVAPDEGEVVRTAQVVEVGRIMRRA